jgi:SAM-dependent methyltransferase
MSDRTDQSIANSFEVSESLLPYVPFLLQDLWALGSSVEYIIDTVGALDLSPAQATILDLGCGKGAVSIKIASLFGLQVVGIDAMPAFLEDARRKAIECKVSHLCEFINQDMKEYVSVNHSFDMVILASLGGVFGSFKDTISILRKQVRTGGYMLIDDGYLLTTDLLKRNGYEHYRNHETTINELTASDDLLLKEISTTDLSLKINNEYLHFIDKRGRQLIAEHPGLSHDISAYIQLQKEECEVINDHLEGALWLLQKRA